ncbi:transcriptional regulator [Chromatium weissei]|nr:transcriptional regulator [Chromatium weissei]
MRLSCVKTLIVNCCWVLLLSCGMPSPLALAQTASTPALTQQINVLLERMTHALHTLNYEGVLVYLHDNRLETLNLLHRVAAGQVQERLVSLSGPVRTVARERNRILSAQPEGQPFAIEPPDGGHILATAGINPAALNAHYRIAILGTARIAGRDTDVIGIIPRDALRYGYRFYIDQATALPLKSDLIDQQEEPLEQLMFTTISLSASDSTAPIQTGQPMRNAPATEASSRWRFETTPAGFELVFHREMRQPDGTLTEHFLFTDRLCAYSIYIEDDSQEGLDGVTNTGAVHAAGRTINGYRVTALGEVPAATVAAAIAGAQRN